MPDFTSFRFYFPKTFMYQEIEERFLPILRDDLLPYESVVDFLNSTITNSSLPEIEDQGSNEQSSIEGKGRTYKGSMQPIQLINREITVTMTLKGSYINWVIMMEQLNRFLSFQNEQPFLPDVFAQFTDFDDNVIMELVYSQVRMTKVGGIDLSSSDQGITTRDFDVNLTFNEFRLNTTFERRVNRR